MKSDVLNKPYIVEDGYPFIIVPLLLAVAAGYFLNAYVAVLPGILPISPEIPAGPYRLMNGSWCRRQMGLSSASKT